MKLGFIDAINQQRPKVREVLLDLERNCPGAGHALRPVFFNGLLNDKDKDWEKDDVNWPKAQERLTQMEVLGERHPETIQNLADLAATYQQQDRLREAEGIYVRVLQLWKKTLGQKNPDTVQNIVDLAAIYYLQGGSKDAEEIYVNVLGLRKDGICKKHPDTIRKIAELAAKYHMKNQSTQLENVKVEVLRLQKEVLGEKHHDTIQTMKDLAAIYNEQGKAAAALDIEENVLRLQEEGHPHTMLSIARLASEYQQRQKVKTR
jgi:tetratricopeptide (TPR) repeat protein